MPDLPADPTEALTRWLRLGCTSQTHPLLRFALERCFQPLGIAAAWLEADVLSALETGRSGWWLRDAHWDPIRFDRTHPAGADFAYVLDHPASFAVGVSALGELALSLRPEAAGDAGAAAYFAASEGGWLAIRHSVRAAQAVETFLFVAAGLILAGDPLAALFVNGKDEDYGAAVAARIAAAASRENNSASAGVAAARGRAGDSSTTESARVGRGKSAGDRPDRGGAGPAPNPPRPEAGRGAPRG